MMKMTRAPSFENLTKIATYTDTMPGLVYSLGVGLLALVLLMVTVLLSSPAQADVLNNDRVPANQIKMTDVHQGSLLFRTSNANIYRLAPTVDTQVVFNISGMIARATVKQTFTNPDNEWVEGIYVFPLPENAAVDHLRMRIGERVIEGEIKEKAEAKKVYEQAKREGKKASLVEQERPNLFTNSVANIGPYDSITVEIEFQQSVKYEQINGEGRFQLRFPTTFTPRYIPGNAITEVQSEAISPVRGTGWAVNTDQVPDASRITPAFRDYGDWSNPISISVHLNAGFPVDEVISPYHEIQTTYNAQGQIDVELAEGSVPANRDFNLIWTVDSGHSPKAALFNQQIDGNYYHLIMILPPTDGVGSNEHLSREVIFVIDTSGSMSGASMEQAKAGLKMALERLRDIDTFNIIEFDDQYTTLFSTPQPASYANIHRAMNFVDRLNADGGTEMLPALKEALSSRQHNDKVQQVIFLTDGSVGNETELFKLINDKLGNRRLFTVGIGSAPNSYFMTKAAEFGRGTFTYIGSVDEVQSKMEALYARLETPVLTNLSVDFPVDADLEIWPKRIPDLYLGEPLVITAQTGYFAGDITISGQRQNTQWRASLPLQGGKDSPGVGALWARSKIKSLMDSIVEGEDKTTVKTHIVDVALRHHLVSQYTSLVAVDKTPARIAQQILKRRNIANNLPQGSHFGQFTQGFAKTATEGQIKLTTGFLLLLISLVLALTAYRQKPKSRE